MITTKSKALAAIEPVAAFAARKSTMPVLTGICLRGGHVEATDRDSHARAPLDGLDVEGVVDARHLVALLRAAPDGELAMERDGSRLRLSAGGWRVSVPLAPADEFPARPTLETSPVADGAALLAACARVLYAASHDETRYVLNGVLVGGGHAVATDGHRMAIADAPDCAPSILPRSLLERLGGMTVDSTGIGGGRVVVTAGALTVSGRLIEGRFPDWRQVLPGAPSWSATVGTVAALEALKRVSVVDGPVRLSAGAGGPLALRVAGEDGEASDAVDRREKDAIEERVANGRYLADAIRAVGGETVAISGSDPVAPLLISGDGGRAVVMPMRV